MLFILKGVGVVYSLAYRSNRLFFRDNQKTVYMKINISALLDEVMYFHQLIKVAFDFLVP